MYGWFSFDFNESSIVAGRLPGHWVQWIVVIAERAFFAAFFAVIGAGIWRELTRSASGRAGSAMLVTPVLLIALIGIGAVIWW